MNEAEKLSQKNDQATTSHRAARQLRVFLSCVAFATVGILIVVPRPTFPELLPLPDVDPQTLAAREKEEQTRLARATSAPLSNEVRAVGEQVRRIGLLVARSQIVSQIQLSTLATDIQALLQKNQEVALLDLRALQTELFLLAVREFESSQESTQDLEELGGHFALAVKSAWLDENHRLLLSDDQLRVFFRTHWGRTTGLSNHPRFSPNLEELRYYYSSHLRFPYTREKGDVQGALVAQLAVIQALGRVDSTYPTSLATGIIQLRLGLAEPAEKSLRHFLETTPNGQWSHIAQNHLRLAARQTRALSP